MRWRGRVSADPSPSVDVQDDILGPDTGLLRFSSGMGETSGQTIGRRRVLGLLGVAGAAGLLRPVEVLAGRREQGSTHRKTKTAYRLSTHGRRVCNACKGHAANRYYRTPKAADGDRAHTGCNCAIVPHPLPAGTYHHFFSGKRDVWDARWEARSRSRVHGG